MISKDNLNFIGVNNSDTNFQVTSIGTYFKDKAMDSLQILNAYCACLSDMSQDNDLTTEEISTLFDTKCQEFIPDLVFDSSHYTNTDEGNVRMDQLRTAIINDLYLTNNSDPTNFDQDTSVPLYSNNGTEIGSMEVDDFFEQLKESAKASYSIGAGMIASQYDSISDRMTAFNEDIRSKFSDELDDSSGTSEYCRSLLTSGENSQEYMNSLSTTLDMDVTLISSSKTPINSQVGQMTGRTPAMAWGFVKPFQAVGSAVGKAAEWVWNAFKVVVNGIVGWIGSKIKDLSDAANAANDCYVVNKNSNAYTVDAWAICENNSHSYNYYFTNEDDKAYITSWVRNHLDGWFKVSTMCGELLFKLRPVSTYSDHLVIGFDYKYKPKVINLVVYDELMTDLGFTVTNWCYEGLPTVSDQEIIDAFKRFRNNPDLFTETYPDNERYRMVALCLARNIDQFFPTYIMQQNVWNGVQQGLPSNMFPTGYRCSTFINKEILPDAQYDPTNLDFVHAASALYKVNGTWTVMNGFIHPITFARDDRSSGYESFADVNSVARSFVTRLIEIKATQRITSQVYMPYLYGDVSFSLSRYGIKTDDENNEAFNRMVDTIAYITIGIVVGASVLTASKVIKTATYTSRSKTISQIGAKMSAGLRISPHEAGKYRRANKTIQKMNARMAGIKTNGVNAYTALLANNTWNNDDIANLIK